MSSALKQAVWTRDPLDMAPHPARPPGSQLATPTARPLFLALRVWQHVSRFTHQHCKPHLSPASPARLWACTESLHGPSWELVNPVLAQRSPSPAPLSLCPALATQLASARSALPGKANSTVRQLFTPCPYLHDIFRQHLNPAKHHGAASDLCRSLPTSFSLSPDLLPAITHITHTTSPVQPGLTCSLRRSRAPGSQHSLTGLSIESCPLQLLN